MTTKAAFSPEEWTTVLEGPTSAGMIVITASHGGMFKETFAMSKAYTEARSEHGQSELLDEIVSAKPEMDHAKFKNPMEAREHGLDNVRHAMAVVESKATPAEVDGYRNFVFTLASKVAAAHKEGGQAVSAEEAQAMNDIATALGKAA